MKNITKFATSFFIMALTAASLSAQEEVAFKAKVDIGKPTFENHETPTLATMKGRRSKPKDWMEVAVEFQVEKILPAVKDDTLPELLVKWFVVAEDPNRPGKYILLTKEVKHVNIPVGENLLTSCYISPSGVRRLNNGRENVSKNMIYGVGGEFMVSGERVGYFTSKSKTVKVDGEKKPFWYSPDLSESNSVKIYQKNETPFEWIAYDAYAELDKDFGNLGK